LVGRFPVWRGGLGFPFRLAVLGECHLGVALAGAVREVQLDGVAGCAGRAGQVVDGAGGLAGGRRDQVAGCRAGAGGRAVFGCRADERALGAGEAGGAPQPPGRVARE
jgi:hypothetical protein